MRSAIRRVYGSATVLVQGYATHAKKFSIYAATQVAAYTILVVNMRAVAHGSLPIALVSDGLYAVLAYTVIKRIAHDDSSREAMYGYVVGSLIGTTIGMHF